MVGGEGGGGFDVKPILTGPAGPNHTCVCPRERRHALNRGWGRGEAERAKLGTFKSS